MAQLTIGLPVFNGAKTLRASLDSILNQTFADFVLTISDNASTDETRDICEEYLQRDSRISYFRHPSNIVWNDNFRSVLIGANTPYFMWMTHDDVWAPRFAERNIAALERNPGAVCSVSRIVYFSSDGSEELCLDTGPLTGLPGDRLRKYLLTLDKCGRFYGVYRTRALQNSFPDQLKLYGADVLVAGLTLLEGDHLEVEEVLLRREAQPADHYIKGLGSIDRSRIAWYERLLPLHKMRNEMRNRLPRNLWRRVRMPLLYLELRHFALAVETNVAWIRPFTGVVRRLMAALLHRRWQSVTAPNRGGR